MKVIPLLVVLFANPLLAAGAPPTGLWHARLIPSPGREVAFDLKIEKRGSVLAAGLLNAASRIAFTSAGWDGTTLTLSLAHLDATLTARRTGEGLEGTYARTTAAGRVEVPFAASVTAPPIPKTPAASVAGTWGIEIDDGGSVTKTTGIFRQSGGEVSGTMREATGDYGALHGTFDGTSLVLQVFDGVHIYRFDGTLAEDGTLKGEFRSRTSPPVAWRGRRLDAAAARANLPDGFAVVKPRDSSAPYRASFPDEEGNIVSIDDPPFAGKPMIVSFTGTWCPNCNEEAPVLKELYEKYGKRGLEVVSLSFEYTDDMERNRRQVKRFRERYGLPYPVLIAGTTKTAKTSSAMEPLDGWQGYPTTLFLDRRHRIVKIHSGFDGPATGEHYTGLKKEMRETVEGLLR